MCEVNQQDGFTFLICTHNEGVAARCGRRLTFEDGELLSNVAIAPDPYDCFRRFSAVRNVHFPTSCPIPRCSCGAARQTRKDLLQNRCKSLSGMAYREAHFG